MKPLKDLRVVVSGLIAQYPLGGVTWDYVQYVVGLKDLGCDVFYLENTGQWPYDPTQGATAKTGEFNANYLAAVMQRFGLADRWSYRFPWQNQWYGVPENELNEFVGSADLLLNVSGTLAKPWEYSECARLAYIDSDPVFTHVKLARGQYDFRKMVDAHDVHFSFGERNSDEVPDTGHDWRPTRQPIVLSQWEPTPERRDAFTTIMNWTSYKDVTYQGKTYGQKDVEFARFMDLPCHVSPTELELAVNIGKTRQTPRDLLFRKGWRVVDPGVVCPDMDRYRDYIRTSKAEWSVAKGGYVIGKSGWFSCRSACYLAAGRPVVVQDTGFGEVIPTGVGVLTFQDIEQAVSAIRNVETNYRQHAEAARNLAEEFFDSRKVLCELIEQALT